MFMFVVEHPRRPTQTSVSTDADVRIDRRRRPYRPTQMLVVLLRRYSAAMFCVFRAFGGIVVLPQISPSRSVAPSSLAEWQHLVVELGGRAHAQHLLDDCILSILFSAVTIFSRSPLPFVERRSRCRPYFDRIWSFIISR